MEVLTAFWTFNLRNLISSMRLIAKALMSFHCINLVIELCSAKLAHHKAVFVVCDFLNYGRLLITRYISLRDAL